jgi:hypothetical protein
MQRPEFEARSQTGRNSYLYREALQNDYVDFSLEVRSSGMFYARPFQDRETQLRCYLCESLLTALEHPDPIIRLRAACQAFAYAGRLEGMGTTPGSRHCDALLEVRNMLEEMVRPVA